MKKNLKIAIKKMKKIKCIACTNNVKVNLDFYRRWMI